MAMKIHNEEMEAKFRKFDEKELLREKWCERRGIDTSIHIIVNKPPEEDKISPPRATLQQFYEATSLIAAEISSNHQSHSTQKPHIDPLDQFSSPCPN
jgi:hypothetical protein